MKVKDFLNKLDIINTIHSIPLEAKIKGISDNSMNVDHHYIFVAIKGVQSDGHNYIGDAIKKGARIIIGENELTDVSVPYIQVKDSRKALGYISKEFYGNPSQDKTVIGITGTNGKTTTSYFIKNILEKNQKSCTLIGTIEYIINGETVKSLNTTPSSLILQELISKSRDDVVIIEVSSHGLAQSRVEGLEFDICLFTNLEPEHLDYHESMENYFKVKMTLFNYLKEDGHAIINTDNEWGMKAAQHLQNKNKHVHAIGQEETNHLQLTEMDGKTATVHFTVNQKESYQISMPIPGIHNMYNAAFAFQTAACIGIDGPFICDAFTALKGINGRFEMTKLSNNATVVVDYAHTTDAISHCLTAAKHRGASSIIHIFGFRGDRDKAKRKEMLSLTSRLSDYYILTMDDLNSVEPMEMLETLEELHEQYGNENGIIIADRTMAIKWAMDHCSEGDWIVITGKGHETYQQNFLLGTQSDKETVDNLIDQQGMKQSYQPILKGMKRH
ncbi:UDP-N-acetylmuramoyl-L-alanyl-D-glutamate--2,6-diaminopimelate ligase [Oceanobacillus salinisoli]|uniref:UDP-N-acetylmuramoyl-L-alanyl-D-glutamate--2, 6-diaminopimelate ligase n=1 Tax=Oceanobacillus salinisoli TaxID=2678611 RepID=UPI0012E29764|nr:UDP-N-acetylmuramoyl-L-alanyl-D-glutamate--2,6-diaminopimelate ligase [Oceanobacillus salinisoli]